MKPSEAHRRLTWMPLMWVGAVYLWSLFALWANSPQRCTHTATSKEACHMPGSEVLLGQSLLPLLLLTCVMGLHGVLLWLALRGRIRQRYAWPYLGTQALLLLLMGIAIGKLDVVQPVYLALTLGAVGMLPQARATLLAVSLLFLLKGLASAATAESWSAFLLILHTDYVTPLFLFVMGYLVLYIQQSQLYAKLSENHSALERANAQLEASLRQITILTRQNERQRLAREWHDTLAQSLLALVRQLDVVRSHLASQRVERAREIVSEVAASARVTLAEARNAISDLRTNIPTPETLAIAAREEIDRFTAATGITCEASLSALVNTPSECCEPVLRTVSEGLRNIARHAQARNVWIDASHQEGMVCLLLRDDGVGLPDLANIGNGHYGLVGLRERARLANGRLEMKSQPGEGTTLCLYLPLRAKEVLI